MVAPVPSAVLITDVEPSKTNAGLLAASVPKVRRTNPLVALELLFRLKRPLVAARIAELPFKPRALPDAAKMLALPLMVLATVKPAPRLIPPAGVNVKLGPPPLVKTAIA